MSMEVGWRMLLSVFLSSVLLIGGGVSNAQQTTDYVCATTVSTQHISQATVAAAGVFEGRLELLQGPPTSSSSSSLNATFSFRRSHKGKFKGVGSQAEVVVRLDLIGDTRTDGRAGCSPSQLLVLHRNYLVFVGQSVETEVATDVQTVFQSTAFPVPLTKDAVRQIRAYQCRKCGRIRTRLMPPRLLTVHEGESALLMCRATGKPVDDIRWFKNRRPLVMTERVNSVTVRKGTRLVLENVTTEDSGMYQCQASNAVMVTPSLSTVLHVQSETEQREALCASQDYCLNHGTCYVLTSLGRKFCRCPDGFTGHRCFHHNSTNSHVSVQLNWWMVSGSESLIIVIIAVGTLLLACCLIATLCIARNYCERKRQRRIARSDSDYRPPSLPDGHAVNVVHLNAAMNRRSAAYSINLAADGSIEPIANPESQPQPRIPDHELPILRRGPRSNASNSVAARGSGQVRLSMLSNASSQLGSAAQRPQLAAVPSAADPGVQHHEPRHHQVVIEPTRSQRFVNPDNEQIELDTVEQAQLLGATVEDTASPRASQCSHTESLICGIVSPDDAATVEAASHVDDLLSSEPSTAPRRPSFTAAAASEQGSAAASDDSDNYPGYDLEVNFESEADMLAVETSGDELERGGITTSHDFSELSSQLTTDRGSSDDDDDDDEMSDNLFANRHLLGVFEACTDGGSSGDLSWDASAEMPSFALASSAAEIPLQFSKR